MIEAYISQMKKLLMTAISLSTLAVPASAESNYNTPEYSGPSARIESGGMRNSEPMVTRRPPLGPSPSDRGFDTRIEDRGARITGEMDRRREDSIRMKQEHILKTNE